MPRPDMIDTTTIEDHLRPRVEEVIGDLARLVPCWCHRLWVVHEDVEGGAAEARIDYDHRSATIVLTDYWVAAPADDQRAIVLHEIVHLHLAPLYAATVHALKAGIEDEAAKQIILGVLETANEGATEDLCAVLIPALFEREPRHAE